MHPIEILFRVYSFSRQTFSFEVDFSDTCVDFRNIRLRAIESSTPTTVAFHVIVNKNAFNRGYSETQALIDEASREAELFVCVFSHFSGIKMVGFEFVGFSRNGQLTTAEDRETVRIGNKISGTLNVTVVTQTPSAPALARIKREMISDYDLTTIAMFHHASTTLNPTLRFLSLYLLMLHKNGDRQAKVDEAILAVDPSVARFKRTERNSYETIFTKLRNEIAHKRQAANFSGTYKEIEKNVDRFENIVKIHLFPELKTSQNRLKRNNGNK